MQRELSRLELQLDADRLELDLAIREDGEDWLVESPEAVEPRWERLATLKSALDTGSAWHLMTMSRFMLCRGGYHC